MLVPGGDGHGVVDAFDPEGLVAGGAGRDARLAVTAFPPPAAHLARAHQGAGENGARAANDGDARIRPTSTR